MDTRYCILIRLSTFYMFATCIVILFLTFRHAHHHEFSISLVQQAKALLQINYQFQIILIQKGANGGYYI